MPEHLEAGAGPCAVPLHGLFHARQQDGVRMVGRPDAFEVLEVAFRGGPVIPVPGRVGHEAAEHIRPRNLPQPCPQAHLSLLGATHPDESVRGGDVGELGGRAQGDGTIRMLQRRGQLAFILEKHTQPMVGLPALRKQAERLLEVAAGRLMVVLALQPREDIGQEVVSLVIGGIQAHRLERRPAGALQIAHPEEDRAQRTVGLGGTGIQRDRLLRGDLALAKQALGLAVPALAEGGGGAQFRQGPGILSPGRCIVRLELDGRREQGIGQPQGVLVAVRDDLERLGVEFAGSGQPGLGAQGAGIAAEPHLLRQALLQFVLELQQVRHGTVQLELVQGRTPGGIHHTHAHPKLPANHLIATEHQQFRVEQATQFADRSGCLAGRIAQLMHGLHHPEAIHHCEVIPPHQTEGHGIGEAIAQPGVLAVRLQLLQGQDGHHPAPLGEILPRGPSGRPQARGIRPPHQTHAQDRPQDQHRCHGAQNPGPAGFPEQPLGMVQVGHRRCGVVFRESHHQRLEVREPVLRDLGQQAVNGILEGAGQIGARLGQGSRHVPGHGVQGVHQAPAQERMHGGGQLIEHHAQAELVRLTGQGLAIGLLRAHVGRRALAVARRRPLHQRHVMGGRAEHQFVVASAGNTEVEDLQLALVRQQQVLGLDVAVDDALLVGVGQGRGGLLGQILKRVDRQGLAHQGPQGAPLNQLHRNVGGAVHLAGVVDVGDVRVVQLAGQLGLADERLPAQVVRILEDLERYLALQPQIQRPPDLAHGPLPQSGEQTVGTEGGDVGGQADPSNRCFQSYLLYREHRGIGSGWHKTLVVADGAEGAPVRAQIKRELPFNHR